MEAADAGEFGRRSTHVTKVYVMLAVLVSVCMHVDILVPNYEMRHVAAQAAVGMSSLLVVCVTARDYNYLYRHSDGVPDFVVLVCYLFYEGIAAGVLAIAWLRFDPECAILFFVIYFALLFGGIWGPPAVKRHVAHIETVLFGQLEKMMTA